MLIDINNYWKFDSMGYHSSNNASFGTINSIEDITLGTDKVVDGMYATEFTVKSTIQGYDSFSAVSGLTFDCEYITEIGNGKYKIAVPQDKQADFATGVIVKVMRGTEEVGKFALKLTNDIPVTSVKISGPDAAFIGGESVQYTATVTPDNATHPEVTWDSSDKEVATIDQSGNVTIVGAGTTTITATAGGIIAEHTLVVLTREAVVKVTYANGTVVNSGTGSDIVIDTVTRNTDANGKNATAFEHTDNNTFVKGLNGDANGALQTNNSKGSYLLIKDYNLGTNDFTISAWVYVADTTKLSTGGGSQLWATCRVDESPAKGLMMSFKYNKKTSGAKIVYRINGATDKVFCDNEYDTKVNGWHKYTMTRKDNVVSVYLDKTLVSTSTIAAANLDFGTQTICFGAYINETWAYQNYNIAYDNVAIYDYALTANQIAALTAKKI